MIRLLGLILFVLFILALSAWGCLALYYSAPPGWNLYLAISIAGLGVLITISLVLGYRRNTAVIVFAGVFAMLISWWVNILPANDRNWQQEVAVLPYATINGDLVTIHNIRNFDYQTAQEFEPAYYDKTFDLGEIKSVDLFNVYWMGPAIAHSIFSFGFNDGSHVAFSIETRKEVGEGYSTIKGFFKQYELYYVVADERDVIGVRTNYRDPPEDVYLYQLDAPAEKARYAFMRYIDAINELKQRPKFYNTLMNNCTTTVWLQGSDNPNRIPFSWKLIANGYLPDYLYERGLLDNSRPFDELKKLAYINSEAEKAAMTTDFSALIRREAN